MNTPPTMDRPFADFELRLKAVPEGFMVEAEVEREGPVSGVVLPQSMVDALAQASDPSRAADELSSALFAGEIEDVFIHARKMRDDGVRVGIDLGNAPAVVANLPWEWLRAPGDEVPLARNPNRPFARRIRTAPRGEHAPRRDLPLHVLVVVDAAPAGGDRDAALAEPFQAMVDSLTPWLLTELVRVTLWMPQGERQTETPSLFGLDIVTADVNQIGAMLSDVHVICALGVQGQDDGVGREDGGTRVNGLDALLEKAEILPPLLITIFDAGYTQLVGADFILGQGAQRFRDRFARGLRAYLSLPLHAQLIHAQSLWSDLLTGLLSHGAIDIATNQLRADWADQGPDAGMPVLWTNLDGARLFAFDFAPDDIDRRLKQALGSSDPSTPRLAIVDLGDRVSIGGVVLPKRRSSTVATRDERTRKAAPDIDIEQGEDFLRIGDQEVPINDGASEPPPEQPPETQADAASTAPAPTSARGDVIYISPARYEPPPSDQRVALRVNVNTVTLTYDDVDYTSRNLLAQDDVVEALNRARGDWHRYGRALFDAVINDVAPQSGDPQYTTAYGFRLVQDDVGAKPQNSVRFELLLDRHNSEMHLYQWEFLCPPDDTPLALREASPFYRRSEGQARTLKVQGATPKVLVAICNPPELQARLGLEPLNVGLEQKIADVALSHLAHAGLLTYKILPDADTPVVTLEALTAALQEGYHALQLVCHGYFDPLQPQAPNHLVIEREGDVLPLVTATQMNALVSGAGNQLRLMVLASCQSAVDAQGNALRGLGPQLVTKGKVPAVIAMQQPLAAEAAQLFTRTYYDDLARSGRVDMALAATRLSMYQHAGMPTGAWGVPVLYMSTGDGEFMAVDRDAASHVPRPPADIRSLPQMGAVEDPRMRALGNMLAQQAQALGAAGVVGPLQQAIQAGAQGPLMQQVEQQDRDALSDALPPTARLDVDGLAKHIDEIAKLKLPAGAAAEIAAALNMGKHIILLGPPGTGKTSLAHAICDFAAKSRMCRGKTVTTATADWSTFDTVGGYVPSADQGLTFQPGNFLHAISAGEWLVIDEINRAEIDKAFGELFTVLSGQQVDTPYRVGGARVRILPHAKGGLHGWIPRDIPPRGYDYVVHPHWRIIGTMNVYDRSSLYAMSLAFMRRFAFIDLGLPDEFATLREEWVNGHARLSALPPADRAELVNLLAELVTPNSHLMLHRALGPAIVEDMINYVGERHQAGAAMGDLLADAFLLFAAPQLDGLDAGAIEDIYAELDGRFGGAGKRARILARIAALYPFIHFGAGE